jgi:Rieske Fe-S protein
VPNLFNIRRRKFVLGAATLAMTCGGEPDDSTTATSDTGNTTADPGTTAGDPTTVDPTTEAPTTVDPTTGTPTTSDTTDTTTGAGVCMPVGLDTGYLVAEFAVGACMPSMLNADVYVMRDDAGFYAFRNKCTHDGCEVPCPVDGVIVCPCHGSTFNLNGDVTGGPALEDLRHYLVTFECVGDDVKIYVDKNTVLDDRQTRAVPP